jgi:hypothetical protein
LKTKEGERILFGFFFFFSVLGFELRGMALSRQVLYTLSQTSAPGKRILKAAGGKQLATCKGSSLRLPAECSSETGGQNAVG